MIVAAKAEKKLYGVGGLVSEENERESEIEVEIISWWVEILSTKSSDQDYKVIFANEMEKYITKILNQQNNTNLEPKHLNKKRRTKDKVEEVENLDPDNYESGWPN